MSDRITFADPRLTELDGFAVTIDEANERADIVLDNPPYNVISMGARDQLRLVFEALDEDDRIRVIVLSGKGAHFSSGGNIKGFLEATPEHVSKLAWNIAAPARCTKPVIAMNRGYTFGVGFEISLACDFRIVSETCEYALPEQKLGQIPGSGGSARLQKIVGVTRTKHIVMRSKRIPGLQALDWGIATECVADDKLEETVDALVAELRTFSPIAQRTAKKLLNDTDDALLTTAIELAMPVAVALRSVPIVTTAPLIVLALGRGALGTTTLVAIMVFFPSFVACLHGLRQAPGQIMDVFDSYAAGPISRLIHVSIPAMLPAFFAAARMSVPAAVLAVTVIEWLATGRGIGSLMALSASLSDYDMLWASVVAVALLSVLCHAAVAMLERRVLRVFAAEQAVT